MLTGDIEITVENAQELVVAADMLEIHHVVHVGTNFLTKELHPSNALGIYRWVEEKKERMGKSWVGLQELVEGLEVIGGVEVMEMGSEVKPSSVKQCWCPEEVEGVGEAERVWRK